MNTPDALAALSELAALSQGRRHYLATVVATAPTDQDRARIVMMARRENIDRRWATEHALKAELDDRREWAARNPLRPAEGPQRPSQRLVRTDDTTPKHRPVVVTWGLVTKTAKVEPVRPEGIGTNRVYNDAPKTPDPTRTHGIVSTYNWGCRCTPCSEASASYGREYRARKLAEKRSGKTNR